MKRIVSRDNPTFRDLRDLARDSRRQKREGRALIDGPHLVAAAIDHGVMPEIVVVSESAVVLPEVAALLARMPGVPALCLRDELVHEISELKTPVGSLAFIAVLPASTFTSTGDCLLLDTVQDAGNVGTLLRTAAAAGVRDVLLGPGCAGAWTPRVLRAGQGAHFALNIYESVDLAAFLGSYAGRAVATVAHAGRSLYDLDCAGSTAWLFGSEGAGVATELIGLCSDRVTIPLAPDSESLNVAAAAAVCLFEMRRQRTMEKSTLAGRHH